MSEQLSYCPQCHNEVQFARSGDTARCPVCGFEFHINAGPGIPPKTATSAMSIGRVLLRIILIIIGVVVLGIAVLFAGCAILLSGTHI